MIGKKVKNWKKKLIFFTVGTGPYQFDRLLRAADKVFEDDSISNRFVGFAQTGSSKYLPMNMKHVKFMTKEKYESLLGIAWIVVHPGGAGTTITCLAKGIHSVIFPRETPYGEIRNESSTLLAKTLQSKGLATYANDYDGLMAAIEMLDGEKTSKNMKRYRSSRMELCGKLRTYLEG